MSSLHKAFTPTYTDRIDSVGSADISIFQDSESEYHTRASFNCPSIVCFIQDTKISAYSLQSRRQNARAIEYIASPITGQVPLESHRCLFSLLQLRT